MKYGLLILAAALSFNVVLSMPSAAPEDSNQQIIINNRILTTVNSKPISVLDVMKKMDVFLSERYPQYLDLPLARLQFYKSQWRQTLQNMIDQELMMADAQSRKIDATDAEVREEIQNRYGPNIMQSLDKLSLTYEEAKEMVHQDLVVQKIQWLRVTSKALTKVTTDLIRQAYNQYLKENPPKDVWTYQFLTLRYEATETAMQVGQEIMQFYNSCGGVLSLAVDLFKQRLPQSEWTHVSLSSELQTEDKDLSLSHRQVLSKLTPHSWSNPVIQTGRDGLEAVRIFHLKSHTKQQAPTFEALAARLKQDLLNQQAEVEMASYLARLHDRFDFDPQSLDIPSQFDPFSF